jgi:hypothetical protein
MSVETKRCTKCGEVKSVLDFYVDNSRKDGRAYVCKQCNYVYKSLVSYSVDSTLRTKICFSCKRELPILKFALDKRKKDGLHVYCKECIRNKSVINRCSPAQFESYATRLTVLEDPKKDLNNLLIVTCAYIGCQNEFTPNNGQVRQRLKALEGKLSDNSENRIYCSQECKDACSVYRVRVSNAIRNDLIAAGHLKIMKREVSQEFRTLAFQIRGMICERCGESHYLHVHHIEGVKESPGQQFDIENVRIYCKDCHKEVHKQPGCSYQDYSCSISSKYTSIFDAPEPQPSKNYAYHNSSNTHTPNPSTQASA